ncbi:MAG: hypothetical protein ABUL65_04205 [Opitutus sp.]
MKFRFSNPAGLTLGLAVLALLAGCASSSWSGSFRRPTPAQEQAALGRLDRYVYFPGYQVYFNPARGQYTYRDGQAWITSRDLPPDLSLELLEDSPSVAMNFDDAPARHHAAVVQIYPRNWGRAERSLATAP